MYFSCTGGTDSNDHDFYVDDFSMRCEPDPPAGLMATGVSHQRVDLAWLDCRGETGYSIESKQSGGSWSQAAATGTNLCMVCDTGLNSATTYYYRVIAGNDLGPSGPSATGTAVTSPALPAATGTPKDHLAAAVVTKQSSPSRLVPGRYFTYDHDGIGNREWAVLGGGVKTEYAANAMNQITSRTNPGVAHISGYADPGHCVQVTYGGQTWAAHRDGGYYFAAVGVDNASGPVAATIGVTVLDPDGGTVSSEEIPRLVPKASETLGTGELSYDERGNKGGDSIWEYTWDALDRLTAVETGTVIPAEQRVKLTFAYDYLGRRATKTVYHWDGQAEDWSATPEYVRKFIWSGWLLLAEADGDGKLVRSYVWGRDVSGAPGGAAGIGGLLAVRHHDPSDGSITATYWVVPDEHGNVTNLVKVTGASRQVVASFAYSPYGAVLAADGSSASGVSLADPTALCPFLYSTKYYDKETALYYYGYRYLNPATGRWLNRDPIAERGGLNLYAFDGGIDPLGQARFALRDGKVVVVIESRKDVLWNVSREFTGSGANYDLLEPPSANHDRVWVGDEVAVTREFVDRLTRAARRRLDALLHGQGAAKVSRPRPEQPQPKQVRPRRLPISPLRPHGLRPKQVGRRRLPIPPFRRRGPRVKKQARPSFARRIVRSVRRANTKAWSGFKSGAASAWSGVKSGATSAWSGVKFGAGKTWRGVKVGHDAYGRAVLDGLVQTSYAVKGVRISINELAISLFEPMPDLPPMDPAGEPKWDLLMAVYTFVSGIKPAVLDSCYGENRKLRKEQEQLNDGRERIWRRPLGEYRIDPPNK